MQCHKTPGEVYHQICEKPPTSLTSHDVFINALDDTSCDRKQQTRNLDSVENGSSCFVYCAQRSCHAATDFMEKHQAELRQKCDKITYLPNGALAMDEDDLKDGRACHDHIIEYNKKASLDSKACLTCVPGSVPIDAHFRGKSIEARYAVTDEKIPDWYKRRGIYSTLPTPFNCDHRFHPPELHVSKDAPELKLNINNTDLPKDAVIGFWASNPNKKVLEAGKAYGDFSNSGIVQCDDGICSLRVHYPSQYTAEGKVYNPHIHFTVWKGEEWDTLARTVEFFE